MAKKYKFELWHILLVGAILYFVVPMLSPPSFSVSGDGYKCPTVCTEMWVLTEAPALCTFNNCGSGCGPDGVRTFQTEKECKIAGGFEEPSFFEENKLTIIISSILGGIILYLLFRKK